MGSLTENQKLALNNYIAAKDGWCFEPNKYLRSNLLGSNMNLEVQNNVKVLDGAFNNLPLAEEGITVFRGIDTMGYLESLEIGDKFKSNEFWSTSLTKSAAVGFIKPSFEHSHVALIEMEISGNLLPIYNPEKHNGENEIILPRNVLWKVDAKDPFSKEDEYPENYSSSSCRRIKFRLISEGWLP